MNGWRAAVGPRLKWLLMCATALFGLIASKRVCFSGQDFGARWAQCGVRAYTN
jgi:hypothetical protein